MNTRKSFADKPTVRGGGIGDGDGAGLLYQSTRLIGLSRDRCCESRDRQLATGSYRKAHKSTVAAVLVNDTPQLYRGCSSQCDSTIRMEPPERSNNTNSQKRYGLVNLVAALLLLQMQGAPVAGADEHAEAVSSPIA
ncbi:hypothetical protein QAD02_024445 [Eretmocerus hayati]|uniref:Uncharacterized protein n=1 Tax=Eretmocerus hayati TaxID=131215 RepID=A0ACC2Q3M1_9HYME|nr:hypothetical protein QAD02_024445 [Eretmocerus hayati]